MRPLWTDFEYQKHQLEGVEWMVNQEGSFPHGGILCDEMGLGKTIQILGLMKEHKVNATLLIGPICVLNQWQATAERCGFMVWRAHKTESRWEMPSNFNANAIQLYLVNYERVIARPLLVNRRIWDRLVFDEAHRLANHKNITYKSMASIEACHKWFLTATPIVNGLDDIVSLFSLLGYDDMKKTLEDLRPIIEKNVLCRRMEDLRSAIPALPSAAHEEKHILDFATEEEADCYRGIQGAIVKRWKSMDMESKNMTERFRLIMRLRQISIHPQVYIAARKREFPSYYREDWTLPSTKFIALRDLIEKSAEVKQHRWLVFSHFLDEMTLLQDYLRRSPMIRKIHLYNGSSSATEKEEAIQVSKEPLSGNQQEVLLVQLQSGGVGLNLQHCDRIVFMGPWWTAALMDQAIGRAVRIGQKETVVVHHLLLREEATMNIDRIMRDKAEMKRDLCERFLDLASCNDYESEI
jgi:SNF2 family DNA or RNA helicase